MRPRVVQLCWCLSLASACARDPAVDKSGPSAPPVVSSDPTPDPAPDPAIATLTAAAVYHDDYARAELYTWTTVEQLRAIRDSHELLVAEVSTGGRASPFNRALMNLADSSAQTQAQTPIQLQSVAIARALLEHPALRRRRYAWPSPFATTMGLGPRRYGDSLIRIELDDRALVGRFEPAAAEPFAFVDMRGQDVSAEQALAEPERIAAIYHLRGPPELPIAYREYVVCSEVMIASWSFATPEIAARVDAEIELLEALRRRTLAQLPRAAMTSSAAPDWASAAASPTPLSLWHASLAFDNDRYMPSPTRLASIAETLRGYEHDGGPPLRHSPAVKPPGTP